MVRIKRVYEAASEDDGSRVLVDRLWPRGVATARARISWWAKELAPSSELRRWFGHDPERFEEFSRRYREELSHKSELAALRRLAQEGTVTLVYGARDCDHNNAVVLRTLLMQ